LGGHGYLRRNSGRVLALQESCAKIEGCTSTGRTAVLWFRETKTRDAATGARWSATPSRNASSTAVKKAAPRWHFLAKAGMQDRLPI
jgi:hypothetical protein